MFFVFILIVNYNDNTLNAPIKARTIQNPQRALLGAIVFFLVSALVFQLF